MRSADYDVIVVGLGAMGSQALWRLSRRGARVLGVEQFQPGHDRGASHGESRIIRTAYAEGAEYVPLAREAWRLWRELERTSGTSLVDRCGGLLLGPADSGPVPAAAASADAHGLDYEMLTPAQVRSRFPQHVIDDSMVGLFERDAGVIRPERAVLAAVDAARAHGAEVLTHTTAEQVLPHVRVAGRDITARHVVLAAGAWLPTLAPATEQHVTVVRRVLAWFTATDPEQFAPSRFPVFIRSDDSGVNHWYGCPTMDGRTVKVALHHWPGIDEPVDPATGARPPDDQDARLIGELVGRHLPGLDPSPIRMQACTYSTTPDHHFLIGARPDLPAITLLGGFSGHGFKFSPVIGDIAADLALHGRSDRRLDLFDPSRFGPPPR